MSALWVTSSRCDEIQVQATTLICPRVKNEMRPADGSYSIRKNDGTEACTSTTYPTYKFRSF